MGVTNQIFPQERDETQGCLFNATPEDTLNFTATPNTAVLSDIEAFADFMRMLAPAPPAPPRVSSAPGRAAFVRVGCDLCHTPSLMTGKMIASGSPTVPSVALSNQTVNLFSDLLLHHMGRNLEDGITAPAARRTWSSSDSRGSRNGISRTSSTSCGHSSGRRKRHT